MGFMVGFIIIVVFLMCLIWVISLLIQGAVVWGFIINAVAKWGKKEVALMKQEQAANAIQSSEVKATDPYSIIPPLGTTERVIKSNIRQNKKRKTAHRGACLTADENDSPHPPEPKMLPVTVHEVESLIGAQRKLLSEKNTQIKPVESSKLLFNVIIYGALAVMLIAAAFWVQT